MLYDLPFNLLRPYIDGTEFMKGEKNKHNKGNRALLQVKCIQRISSTMSINLTCNLEIFFSPPYPHNSYIG